MRVRACYIDEITLASNYIEFVTYYKSKITIKKSGFVGYYFVAIYIKKASIQSLPFCEV